MITLAEKLHAAVVAGNAPEEYIFGRTRLKEALEEWEYGGGHLLVVYEYDKNGNEIDRVYFVAFDDTEISLFGRISIREVMEKTEEYSRHPSALTWIDVESLL